jgi:hypothetical protein
MQVSRAGGVKVFGEASETAGTHLFCYPRKFIKGKFSVKL